MPDTKVQPSVTLADVQAYCNNIPQDHPSFATVQSYLSAAQQDPASAAANLALIQQLVPSPSPGAAAAAAAAQNSDPLQAVGDLIRDRLSQRSFTAVNPATGNTETMPVPVKNVTVDAEMSGGADNKQSLVFRLHVDHKDTVYQAQIAEQAQAVLGDIHPIFKPTPENPAPVRTGSYRDDTHVSLIADIPAGKNPNDVIAEILKTQKTASVPETSAATSATVDQSTAVVNTAPVAAAEAAPTAFAQGGNCNVTVINGDATAGDKKFADQVQPAGGRQILSDPPASSQAERVASQGSQQRAVGA